METMIEHTVDSPVVFEKEECSDSLSESSLNLFLSGRKFIV